MGGIHTVTYRLFLNLILETDKVMDKFLTGSFLFPQPVELTRTCNNANILYYEDDFIMSHLTKRILLDP